ncbi:MAG: tetraacyldisaccharide 4'-kinase [Proteobacteria bacterium]|nr:tetraacyldisaccharide 4'-kinase [Pseudomonadota bacterium]
MSLPSSAPSPLLGLLRPLGGVLGAVSALRRAAYRSGWCAAHDVGVPVVSVGALTCGGSGKTPIAAWIAERLLRDGLRVGVVLGGYRGAAAGRVLRVRDAEAGAARWYGDEPVWMARRLPQAVVVRGPDKRGAAALAVREGAQVVVVDDGFQHLRLHRALDVVMFDEDGPSPPIPAGRGREWAWSAGAAGLRWWHGRAGGSPQDFDRFRRGRGASCAIASRYQPQGLVGRDGVLLGLATQLRGARVFVLAGVARPWAFLALLRRCGATVVGQALAQDHRLWPARAWRRAAASGADLLVCTEKDLVRAEMWPAAAALVALRCAVEILYGEAAVERALRQLVSARTEDGILAQAPRCGVGRS